MLLWKCTVWHSDCYYSEVSVGGTRKVRRRKKNADGTYGAAEDYHSDDSLIMKKASKQHEKRKKKGKKVHGSDSEYRWVVLVLLVAVYMTVNTGELY